MKIRYIYASIIIIVIVVITLIIWYINRPVPTMPVTVFYPVMHQYDGRSVSITGMVKELYARYSRRGNAYYTFQLSLNRASVTIFSFGKPIIQENDPVSVKGKFWTYRHVGRASYHDEIDASAGSVVVIGSTTTNQTDHP